MTRGSGRYTKLARLVIVLVRQQMQDRYAGTFGGSLWLVVHPLVLLALLWFVFSVGFRAPPQGNVPYVLIIFAALLPWMLFSEALSGTISSVSSKAYLVRKVAFPLEVLPIVPLVAALIPHAILLVVLIGMAVVLGAFAGWQAIWVLLYLIGLLAFAGGLGLFLGAVNVFFKDLQQILTVILNIWFWWTPVVWSLQMVPRDWQWIAKANPLLWVVSGYQAALLGLGPVVPKLLDTAYFLATTALVLVMGVFVFRRLRPHFADVL